MLITLMTDASHCVQTGAAGFGFWCASNRGKLAGGKPLKGFVKDSYEAEMKGVVNALQIAITAGLILSGDTVLIQLDNKGVIRCIEKVSKPRSDVKNVMGYLFTLAEEFDLTIKCRHVKGHSKNKDSRFLANHHCDSRAKTQMRLARKKIKSLAA